MAQENLNCDTDVYNLYPLKNGKVPASKVGLTKFSSLPKDRQKIFQFDKFFPAFLSEKEARRKERLSKYYQKKRGFDQRPINKFIINKLGAEHPGKFIKMTSPDGGFAFGGPGRDMLYFNEDYTLRSSKGPTKFKDGFDALCSTVQEDVVVCTYNEKTDENFVSLIHLFNPGGWAAEWGVGKSFAEIHQNVKRKNGSLVVKNPCGMVKGILKMPESVERVGAISFRPNTTMNRHPENLRAIGEDVWNWDDENQLAFIRFERQTVTPIPKTNSFLFTIKPYWADLTRPDKIGQAIQAIENYDENAYRRTFLSENGNALKALLISRQKDIQSSV